MIKAVRQQLWYSFKAVLLAGTIMSEIFLVQLNFTGFHPSYKLGFKLHVA
jgi:hypothetical protein